jgi:O-methyltransferase
MTSCHQFDSANNQTEINISQRYLDIIKKILTGVQHERPFYWPINRPYNVIYRAVFETISKVLANQSIVLAHDVGGDGTEHRPRGFSGWLEVSSAYTLLGRQRLDNLQWCVEEVLRYDIPGDLIETGVWRGGACILMCAILKAYRICDRKVFGADSFEGLPPPSPDRYPLDKGSIYHLQRGFSVSLDEVRHNFEEFRLLDEQIEFVKGWFSETLPKQAGHTWSVIHLDGDMYQSTMEALENLYPGLSLGGFIIVDDFGAAQGCRQAVLDYRQMHSITEDICNIDWTGIYWRTESPRI